MICVAPNFFSLSINRDSHSNSGRVETPREGSIFEAEEMCLVKTHEESMNFVFANDDLFGASVSNEMVAHILNRSVPVNRNLVSGAAYLAVCPPHFDVQRFRIFRASESIPLAR